MTIKKNKDILQQKRNKLSLYTAQFDAAISLITNTIDSLEEVNHKITSTIQDIDGYKEELATTRVSLDTARTKNERVISNFSALLNVDG